MVVLPAPLGPRKPEDFALSYVEAHVLDGRVRPVVVGYVVGLDHRRLRGHSCLRPPLARFRRTIVADADAACVECDG